MTGKEKCNLLKAIRQMIAKDHGVQLPPIPECTNKGPCPGYCPVCDDEARLLSQAVGDLDKKLEITDPEVAEAMKEIRRKYKQVEKQSCNCSHSEAQDVLNEHRILLERITLLHRETVNRMNSFPEGSFEYTKYYNHASDLKKEYQNIKSNLKTVERIYDKKTLGIMSKYPTALCDEIDVIRERLHRELDPSSSTDSCENNLDEFGGLFHSSKHGYHNNIRDDEEIIEALQIPSSASAKELKDAAEKIISKISQESEDISYRMKNFDVNVLDNESDFNYKLLDKRSTRLFYQWQIMNILKSHLKKRDTEG